MRCRPGAPFQVECIGASSWVRQRISFVIASMYAFNSVLDTVSQVGLKLMHEQVKANFSPSSFQPRVPCLLYHLQCLILVQSFPVETTDGSVACQRHHEQYDAHDNNDSDDSRVHECCVE